MPLVKAICPQCSGKLTIEDSKGSAVCDFCGTTFILEKAVTNYDTTFTNNFNIANANVTITGQSIQDLLDKAEVYISKFGNYKKAFETFEMITEIFPGDYRGWFGLVRAETNDLNFNGQFIDIFDSKNKRIQKNLDKAYIVAPPDKKEEIEKQWEDYNNQIKAFLDLRSLKMEEKELNIKLARAKQNIFDYNKKLQTFKKLKLLMLFLFIIPGAVGTIALASLYYIIGYTIYMILFCICIIYFAVGLILDTSFIRKEIKTKELIPKEKERIISLKQEIEDIRVDINHLQGNIDNRIT